jgi:hypothetical protein
MSDNPIEQYPQPDVRGWLVFRNLPDNLRRAEDATLEADSRYARETGRTKWSRLATEAERTLLQFLGYEPPPNLHTVITYITASIRNRRWPTLEGQTP